MTRESTVYRTQLQRLGYGFPLYEPNPGGDYDRVRVGDVGITDQNGSFLRLFNCLPNANPETSFPFGFPAHFEPLPDECVRTGYRNEVAAGSWLRSEQIKRIEGEVNFSVAAVSAGASVKVTATSKEAAALHIKHSALREDARHQLLYKKYITKHHESWDRFIHDQGFDAKLSDVILVTGHDLTANWATATFIGNASQRSFAISSLDSSLITGGGSLSTESETTIDVPVRVGPNPYNQPARNEDILVTEDGSYKDQCIFLRGWRVSYKAPFLLRLRAEAEPQDPDMDRDSDAYAGVVPAEFDSDEDHHVESSVDYESVLNFILREGADIAIIHECDIGAIAKAIGDDHDGIDQMSPDDLRAKGIDVEFEFDHQLQSLVGTIKLLLDEALIKDEQDGLTESFNSFTFGTSADAPRNLDSSRTVRQTPDDAAAELRQVHAIEDEPGRDLKCQPNHRLPRASVGSAAESSIVVDSISETVSVAPVGDPFRGHDRAINSIAYSPDGCRIVSGSDDRKILIWDAKSGAMIGDPLLGHKGSVTSVMYSPDGRHIVSGSADGTVRIWDAISGISHGEPLRGHRGYITSVTYSPDGLHIASSSADKTICLWNAKRGTPVGEPLEGHLGMVRSVAYFPDGCKIVSCSSDRILLWDVHTGVNLRSPSPVGMFMVSAIPSPDGQLIFVHSLLVGIIVLDAETGQPICESFGRGERITAIACAPDGQHIVSGSANGNIIIWDARTGAIVTKLYRGRESRISSIAYSPDGRFIASGSDDRTVRVWEVHGKSRAESSEQSNTNTEVSDMTSSKGKSRASPQDGKSRAESSGQSNTEALPGPFSTSERDVTPQDEQSEVISRKLKRSWKKVHSERVFD